MYWVLSSLVSLACVVWALLIVRREGDWRAAILPLAFLAAAAVPAVASLSADAERGAALGSLIVSASGLVVLMVVDRCFRDHGRVVEEQARAFTTLEDSHRQLEQSVRGDSDSLQSANLRLERELSQREQIEDELRASESRFRSMAGSVREVFWIADPGSKVHYVSPAYADIFGLTIESLAEDPNSWSQAVHPDDQAKVAAAIEDQRRGVHTTVEYRIIRPDGSQRWLCGRSFPLRDKTLSDQRLVAGVAQDITDSKREETVLRAVLDGTLATTGDEFFEALTARLADALQADWVFAAECVDESRVQARTLAFWSKGQNSENFEFCVTGGPCEQVLAGERRYFPERVTEAFPNNDALQSLSPESYIGVPMTSSEGAVMGHLAVMSKRRLDDGERLAPVLELFALRAAAELQRQRDEQALLASERKFRAAFECSSEAVLVIDARGVVLEANGRALELFGLRPEQSAALRLEDLVGGSVEAQSMLRRVGATEDARLEAPLLRQDGSSFDGEISASGVDVGERTLTQLVIRDATDRRRMEQQLRNSQKLEALGVMAGGVSHDFNNLLTSITSFTSLAREAVPANGSARQYLDEVLEASHRAADVVSNLLAFSRMSSGEIKPVRPGAEVKQSLRLLRPSLPSNVALHEEIDSEAGTVLAEPTQLQQIVINLATNAYQAMGAQGGVIGVLVRAVKVEEGEHSLLQPSPGNYVQISVSDQGPGIDESLRDKIFDPFFTTKEVGSGTGLGLSVVHGIVQGLNGMVRFRNNPGGGATFDVFLPSVEDAAIAPMEEEQPQRAESGRVMVVDDDESVARAAKGLLELSGYEVVAMTDPLAALRRVLDGRERFDIVVTDVAMPAMTGLELSAELLKGLPDLPLLLITGHSDQVEHLLPDGHALPILMKPFDGSRLTSAVRQALHC